MKSHRVRALSRAAALAAGAGLASQASGLTINLNFNAGATDQFIDPFGVNRTNELHAVMQAAADIWEDIIETNFTLDINYWWDDLDPGNLGVHSLVSQSGGRETEGNIRFDTQDGGARRWFFDTTPFDDNEFNMQQTLWRDLTGTQQANWFNGTAHDTFEVGYTGAALASAPADARFGFDLLSVALHEICHALGMSAANTATQAETADGDYDFNTAFTGGQTLAAEIAPGNNIAHLECSVCQMFPSVGTGVRNGPGITDILSSASGANWTLLDVPRKEWVSNNANWTTGIAWIGGAAPGSLDDVYVRVSRTAVLTSSGFANDVFVSEAGNISIQNGGTLNVFGDAIVTGLDSDFIVGAGGELQVAGLLSVLDQAQVFMTGGLVDLNGGAVIEAGAEIYGNGVVDVAGSDLVNDGRIFATGAGLTIQGADGLLDLDGGSGNGILEATFGDLTINGAVNDALNGDLIIGAGRTMTFSDAWELDNGILTLPDGLLDLNGGSTASDAAVLAGATATISGDIQASGVAHINAPTIFSSTAQTTIANGGVLELNGATTMNGGSYTGAGELQLDNTLTIAAHTTIDVDRFDWDGFSGNEVTNVNGGSLFTINSNEIDDGNNLYNGTINLNAGSDLAVNTDALWRMDGLLTMDGGSVISGSDMGVNGDIDSNLSNTITSNIQFLSSSTVSVASINDILNLNGDTTYAGGAYTGAGRLVQIGDATVSADTTISVGVYDWDGGGLSTTTINPNVDFTLNVGALDVGNDQFDGLINIGDGGSLTVNNTANQWTNGGTIHLMGGTLAGETVDNIDLITGFGLITARVLNNGEIEAMGGQLTINSSAAPDIDGTGSPEMGVLSAVDGNLRVVNALGSYAFDGTINVGAARAMLFDSINMFNNGTINMTGGTLILDQLNQNGQMNVNSAISTVQADIVNFGGASNTVINSTLAVGGDTTIASTAVMTGAGTLRNNGDLFGAFNIAVNVDNRGEFNPGTSVGVADIDGDYFNRGGSTMHFEIEGLALNQFDRVNITGQAALDGKLAVVLGGGFTPDWGDSWSIINYGSVVDDFAVFSFDSLADPLLRWWHEATPDSYDIGVRHVADVNRDNVINFEDLNLVVSFFNMTGMGLPGDADEDGDVDFEDLNLVVSFFNTFAPANVPAPGGATLLAISLLVGLRRRRD